MASRKVSRNISIIAIVLSFCLLVLFRIVQYNALHPPAPKPLDPKVENFFANFLPITIVGWNVESGGSDPQTIANELSSIGTGIIALSEVSPTEFDRYALGWPSIHTESGGDDRLQIIVNPQRFAIVEKFELNELNDDVHPAPLVAQIKQTPGDNEFLLVAVHLSRGDENLRLKQAEGLVAWAKEKRLPIVALGDFNFDYNFATKQGNAAFDAFTKEKVWTWVKPKKLIDTNWADTDHDGKDDDPDSMLDFAFLGGLATRWNARCETIEREGDFPDTDKTSDHRPIVLTLALRPPLSPGQIGPPK